MITPSINANWAHSNWNITLKSNANRVAILNCSVELTVEVVLDKAVEINRLGILLGKLRHLSSVVSRELAPLFKVGCLILVAQHRVDCIRGQPTLICCDKCLVILACEHLCTALLKENVQILKLTIQRALVVHLTKCVELCLKCCKTLTVSLFLELTSRLKVDIERMECDSRVCVVWIRVLPSAGHCGIVDRQNLDDVLACTHTPICKQLKVCKVTHAKALLATQ